MRDLHSRMLSALLAGEGLRGIAELAAEEAGEPIAVVLPARGLSGASSDEIQLSELGTAVAAGLRGDSEGLRAVGVEIAAEVEASGEVIGMALALGIVANGTPRPRVDVEEILRTAALAAVAEVAVINARDELAADVRGSLLEDLRAGRAEPAETISRAARLGCDLSRGAVALVASVRSTRPRHAAAVITGEHPGAIAEVLATEPEPTRTLPRPCASTPSCRPAAVTTHRSGPRRRRRRSPTAYALTGPRPSPRSAPTRPSSGARSRRPS